MWRKPLLFTFGSEFQPLMHTKAVLFVDDSERQCGKLYLLLKQRMSANHQPRAAISNGGKLSVARFAFGFATQPGYLHA